MKPGSIVWYLTFIPLKNYQLCNLKLIGSKKKSSQTGDPSSRKVELSVRASIILDTYPKGKLEFKFLSGPAKVHVCINKTFLKLDLRKEKLLRKTLA